MTFKKKGLPHPTLVFGLLWFLATSDWVVFYVLGLVALVCGAGLLWCSLAYLWPLLPVCKQCCCWALPLSLLHSLSVFLHPDFVGWFFLSYLPMMLFVPDPT